MQTFPRSLTVCLVFLTAVMAGWVLWVAAGIIQPLVIALLLASMFQPLVRWAARFKIPPFVTVITIVTAFFFGAVQIAIIVKDGTLSFLGKLPANAPIDPRNEDQRNFAKLMVDGLHSWLLEHRIPEPIAELAQNALQSIDQEALAGNLLGSGVDFTRSLLLVVLYMLFIFAEQAVFRRKILSVFEDRREDARAVLDKIGLDIQRYLGVKTITSLATGALCYAVLVGLNIPYALLLATMTFALNYIPTFGSFIGGMIATAVALIHQPGLVPALPVFLTYVGVNAVLGSYLEPKILGRELNLSPLVVIISVVVWAGLWGAVGTFLAVPLTAAMQIILANNETTRPIAVMLGSGPPRE
ncbi:MAG: AI-2 transport protein TqsA, partial [Planctomycetota bacterium]